MKESKPYYTPKIDISRINLDIITYSETEEWAGPTVGAEKKPEIGTEN